MTYSTPPGWYPVLDPGPDGAAQERWWDGEAWTAEVRPVGAEPVAAAKRGARTWLVLALVLVVLAAGAGGLFWATRADAPVHEPLAAPPAVTGSPSPTRTPSPSATPTPSPTPTPTPAAPSRAPLPSTRSVQDLSRGWEVPVPAGWKIDDHDGKVTLQFSTKPYSCDVGSGNCVRANFAVVAERSEGASAQAVARAEMATYAPILYGDLTSTKVVVSAPVTVAGVTGHAERWRVDPVKGVPGHVLVVAVRAPGGGFTVLVGSADEHPDAPSPELLDQLVAAIRPLPGSQGGGTGVSV
ncbi:hypothetical protein F4556_005434 [Kitasatospora gansuensis]|uniref:DUF2510 domain-containing protein n=1 Tax=Kitasatospora gansuensis TaxID=258050 RepID=A0A7W7SGA0_9ACTN|nr:DUF2510 domain-containing protein [Kitasatospora gansuensis]MBB4949899.1 hypothetical protein [Kitasatospora gansuensis]